MPKYTKEDLRRISWQEYGEMMEKITTEVKSYIEKNGIKIDAVVPIMRGGAFLGTYLTYKLNLLRILPVQYHYFFVGKNKAELHQILFTPKKKMFDHDPTFLVVEGDQCYGNTVIHTTKDLKKLFPNCRILHAADVLDYSYKDATKGLVEKTFYGKYTNHCEELTEKDCKKLGIEHGSTIAPWENYDEEINTMSCKQPHYEDIEEVKKGSEKKQEFNF